MPRSLQQRKVANLLQIASNLKVLIEIRHWCFIFIMLFLHASLITAMVLSVDTVRTLIKLTHSPITFELAAVVGGHYFVGSS